MQTERPSLELVSRDQTLRRERGQGKAHASPFRADHEQNWLPHTVDPISAESDNIHTCVHMASTTVGDHVGSPSAV